MGALWLLLAAVGVGAAWYVHMSAHRDCGRCGSTGRVRRWGAPREER